MELVQAKNLARELMTKDGLTDWHFDFNFRKCSFGVCNYTKKTIFLSRIMTPQMPDNAVRNTILHEIAHALVGIGHHHDNVWRRKAIEIGCDGNRTSHYEEVNVRSKYVAKCPCCGINHEAHRRPKRNLWCKCTDKTFKVEYMLSYIQQY